MRFQSSSVNANDVRCRSTGVRPGFFFGVVCAVAGACGAGVLVGVGEGCKGGCGVVLRHWVALMIRSVRWLKAWAARLLGLCCTTPTAGSGVAVNAAALGMCASTCQPCCSA